MDVDSQRLRRQDGLNFHHNASDISQRITQPDAYSEPGSFTHADTFRYQQRRHGDLSY